VTTPVVRAAVGWEHGPWTRSVCALSVTVMLHHMHTAGYHFHITSTSCDDDNDDDMISSLGWTKRRVTSAAQGVLC
jgi:hypothetical protein